MRSRSFEEVSCCSSRVISSMLVVAMTVVSTGVCVDSIEAFPLPRSIGRTSDHNGRYPDEIQQVYSPNMAPGTEPGSGASLTLQERLDCVARFVPRNGAGVTGRLAVPVRELRSRFPLPGGSAAQRGAKCLSLGETLFT